MHFLTKDQDMREVFKDAFGKIKFTGDLKVDTYDFLVEHNKGRIAEHSERVAAMCRTLARQYGENEEHAETAGLLHDISGVYPNDERISISRLLGLEVLPEEEKLPLILHQKISEAVAREIFSIDSCEILSAIGCHTTLKKGASRMDMILFVADKIEWDQDGVPPYYEEVREGLDKSLESAAFAYLKYQWNNKHKLSVMHPWLQEAYEDLKRT